MSRDLPIPRHERLDRPLPTATVRVARGGAFATVVAACLAILIGMTLGVALTAATTRSSTIGTIRVGPWRIYGDAGSPSVNPYQRARAARTGEIPLASAEGLTIVARSDSAGDTLDSGCTYRLTGSVPPARFWTLEAAGTDGRPFANPAGREAFTSVDLLRDVAGRFAITLAPSVQPGNWMPLPGAGHFEVVLRLYDAGLTGLQSRDFADLGLPSIARLACAR